LTVTWCSTVVAIFFNTFVNPIALGKIGWRYYFVFIAVLIAFWLTAYFFYPETRGHSLEQMAVIFDGEDAEVPPPVETAGRTASISSTVKRGHSIANKEAIVRSERV
jgi:H+/Cl- antiporter ClcA